ncbi:MAG TPA: hypothetical protein VGM17_09165 [Rhizomicrobium sp.]|jgi:hypothetical protein
MYRSILLSAAALILVAGTVSAEACGVPAHGQVTQMKLPPLKFAKAPSAQSIVGTWVTTLIVGGNPIFNTLIQWHDDGTEADNADIPPTGGNTCEGSWVSTGRRTVHRYHLGWTFDPSNGSAPSGMFVLTEDNKLARDGNSYNGTFDQKFYDTNGSLVNEISGDVTAQRVAAQ